jgi:hypothetical protein
MLIVDYQSLQATSSQQCINLLNQLYQLSAELRALHAQDHLLFQH